VCIYVCAPENSSLQFPREALYTNFQLWAITHSAHTSTYRLMRSSEDPVMWLGPVMWAEPLPVFSLYAGRRVTRGCNCIRMIYIHLWYIGHLWGRNQRNSLLFFPWMAKNLSFLHAYYQQGWYVFQFLQFQMSLHLESVFIYIGFL
jgi:hypothetical protein